MNQELHFPQVSEANFESLKQKLASTLLAPESPVASEAAFKRDREDYAALLEQKSLLTSKIEILRSVVAEVRQAESIALESEANLQYERKHLLELAAKLGETSFAGLQSGEVADAPYFLTRKDLQAQIDSLKRQKSSLSSTEPSGVLEQASLKAQQLKLIGQLKVAELKIGSVNRALGTEILSAKTEEAVRCSSTEQILGSIVQQRQVISEAKTELKKAEKDLVDAKKQAADQLGAATISDAASLESELKQQQSQLRSVDTRIEDLEETVVNKALGYEWLRDNAALKEPLDRLAELREEVTPRKLSVWPLAVVVIAGHLFAQFGSEPLNLSAVGILLLYLATGLGGLGLLAYYKPDLAAGERRYKSVLLLFAYSIISVVGLLLFQEFADYVIVNWSERPAWAKGRLMLLDLPRMFLVAVGTAYRHTFAIIGGTATTESFSGVFQNHMLSVGLCEELIKLSPALIAFSAFTGPWQSRSKEFNSQLVYLAMIGGLAFGLGEAVHYHFSMYAPMQAGWGIYATRFLSLVTIHSVWAGISGWLLAHVTGGWIRWAFTTLAHGFGPVGGCLLVAATVGISDLLHTSHNLSNDRLWNVAWDVISLALFAWLIRCSTVSQLVPEDARSLWKRGISTAEVAAAASRLQKFAIGSTEASSDARSMTAKVEDAETLDDVASEPALWNPNAAGFWSLLLSPVFGAWLHAKNWKSLNEPEKSKRSLYWVYGSVAVFVVSFLLPSGLSNLIWTALVVSWWLGSGNEQHRYVNEHYPDYRKKRWGTPLSIGGLCVFCLALISYAVGVDNASHEAMSQLAGTWAGKMQHAEVDNESGVEVRVEFDGTMAFIEDGTSSSQGDVTMTYRDPNGEQAGFVLKLESEGTWSFDGTTLREFTRKISIEPGDAPTRVFADNDPEAFADLRKQMELTGERSYGTVTFSSDDDVDLTDHETGLSASMRRIRAE
ncbi:MAG: hypothetical protein O3B13_21595 [Planctomycetota bacterium]|nr:hypothetical protein [Planctomycetota bacterium]